MVFKSVVKMAIQIENGCALICSFKLLCFCIDNNGYQLCYFKCVFELILALGLSTVDYLQTDLLDTFTLCKN